MNKTLSAPIQQLFGKDSALVQGLKNAAIIAAVSAVTVFIQTVSAGIIHTLQENILDSEQDGLNQEKGDK